MMVKNQKGLTALEVLVSLFVIVLVISASMEFYQTYNQKINRYGEKNTAKNLAISAIETQIELTGSGDSSIGEVYNRTVNIKGTPYKVIVTKTDETGIAAHYNTDNPFYKLVAQVSWRKMDIEVSAYVSEK